MYQQSGDPSLWILAHWQRNRGRMIVGKATMYKQIRILLILVLAAGTTATVTAQEEEIIVDNKSVQCVSLRHVKRTEVIDDRNILFHMRGARVYHNILPRRCSGLKREDRFSYSSSVGRLCSTDSIRVLYHSGRGLQEGNSCRLGLFHEITREDAKVFREEAARPPMANPLPMPEPEEVGSENSAPEEESR